jgi:hypothetical protein
LGGFGRKIKPAVGVTTKAPAMMAAVTLLCTTAWTTADAALGSELVPGPMGIDGVTGLDGAAAVELALDGLGTGDEAAVSFRRPWITSRSRCHGMNSGRGSA